MLAFSNSTMASPATLPTPLFLQSPNPNRIAIRFFNNHTTLSINTNPFSSNNTPLIFAYSSNSTTMPIALSWSETDQESEQEYEISEDEDEEEEEVEEDGSGGSPGMMGHAPPVRRSRRRRYRKQYPGEKKGITEEMRFVAMKLRNNGKPKKVKDNSNGDGDDADDKECSATDAGVEDEQNGESWEPSMEGFLKYLVDSRLVFATVERIVDESSDVSYAYFRKTGLERAECLSKDLELFREQGNLIPEPSNPGVTYAQYLEKSPPLFMSHLYNVYFSHIAGGQVIGKKVSEKLLRGRELEFFKWEGNEEELLRAAREKLNMLGEHWSRDEKNKCLREATKAFRFLGQIVRLLVL